MPYMIGNEVELGSLGENEEQVEREVALRRGVYPGWSEDMTTLVTNAGGGWTVKNVLTNGNYILTHPNFKEQDYEWEEDWLRPRNIKKLTWGEFTKILARQ